MAYSGGAVVAAAAAAKRRRMMLAEEEDMARYTRDDLNNDWEFKIVRSESAAFRKPDVLKKLLEEEAQSGWVMLEKFDDRRIRFKRPRSARTRDVLLPPGVDPYRTRYGTPTVQYVLLVSMLIGVLVLGLGVFGLSLVDGIGAASKLWTVAAALPLVLIALVVLGLLVLVVVRSR
ncbi:MAG: hypothetical protein WBW48_18080 [Anaerolineae bacterium]